MTHPPADDAYIDALASLGTPRSYPKNTILVQEGDRTDQLYVVLFGRLKAYLADAEGKEIIVEMLGPRQYFGEMALDGALRSASVMTVEPSKCAVIEREEFKRFLAEHPAMAFQFTLSLIRRARNLTRTVGNLALLDVYGRVARFLLEQAVEEEGRLVLHQLAPQQEIAKRIGTSRETISRILTDLREGGYITQDGDVMVIRQRLPKRW